MATPLRLLAIEDSEVDYMFILRELKRGGFKVTPERVQTAAAVEAALRDKEWDLIISDYSMPDFDGVAALALYKSSGLDVPFLIVSGAIGEEIAAATMAAGAHDYILKRNLARLVPAVVRELREAEGRRQRRRAEQELRESNERFHLLVEGVKDYAVIMLDPAGNVLNWNAGAERIKGYPAAQIIGKHFSTFYPPEEVAQGRPTMELELATVVGHFEDEGWSVRQDGSRFWANFVLTALRNKAGELRGFGLVTHDVTERSQAEATLRRSEEKYRSIVRNIPDVTWTANVDGQITFISPNVGRLLGFDPEEMEQGGAGQWFGRIQPDDLPRVRAAYAALFAQGTKFEVEYRFQRKDGQLLWVSNRAVATYEVEGVLLADGLMSDITEKKLSDAAMRQSEERFQLVARATNDAVWDWDLRTNDLWWNEGYQSLFGYQQNEIEAGVESWYRKLHPDDAQRVVHGIQQFIETGGQLWSDEYRFQRRDNSYATIYARGCVIRNADGKAVRMIGAMQDVTERRGADEALRLLGSAVHQASESILITTGELTGAGPQIIFANPAFTKMTGHDSATVVGQPLTILQGPKTDLTVLARLQQSLAAGQAFLGETVHYRKDGSEFIMEWQINPIRDKNGAVTHFVAIQRDITARKQAEQKIVEQASLLDLAQDAIVVRDLEGRIEFWNQGAERMFGWASTEAVGARAAQLHFRDTAAYDEAQKLLLEKGEWSGELKQLNRAGKFVTVASRWTLVRDLLGQPRRVLAISSDITEKKQIEAQFLRAQRMDSIGTLASGVAHDLNNILAPIMMSVPMFRAGLKPEENERLIETIETSAQRGAAIVKQLLAFGRGVEGERVVIQIRHVINEMVTIAKETFPKNITIGAKVAKDLWAIKADPTHLHQVLLNLCVNARDAMPNGGSLTLRAENMMLDEGFLAARPDLKPGPFIQLESLDTGTGIPPEIMDKIFDPFFTTKEVGKGTGLGLSTVLGIIKSHGGFVNVYSEIGKGTRFQIFFPALPQTEAGSGKTEQAVLPAGRNETVLFVDDEAGIRESVARILTRHNYRVLAAADGAEALAVFTQNRDVVKVILTDLMMPIMDGMALVRVVQKMDPGMKFIASSGLEQDEKFEELKRCGVKLFLTKPYTAEKLLKGLREVLGD